MTTEQIRTLREKDWRLDWLVKNAREGRETPELELEYEDIQDELLTALPAALTALEAAQAEALSLKLQRDGWVKKLTALEAECERLKAQWQEALTAWDDENEKRVDAEEELVALRAFRDALGPGEWEYLVETPLAYVEQAYEYHAANGMDVDHYEKTKDIRAKLAKALEASLPQNPKDNAK